ncbi:MAG TPA: M3 family metallopeptidase [Trueperaceae bacterium]
MNPLLSREFRIPFDRVRAEHVVPGVRAAVDRAENEIEALSGFEGRRSYDNTVAELDRLVERVDRTVGIVYHLMAVANEPDLRKAFDEALPIFSGFYAKLPTHQGLWGAIRDYSASVEAAGLGPVQARRLEKLLDEFRRAGADLPQEQRERVEQIRTEMARLATAFGNNVLDATNEYELLIEDESDLAGIPDSARKQARASAEQKGLPGWRFTLHAPSYLSFIQYAENRELRRRIHEAYVNRATAGQHDNRPLVREILALRRELAQILGYRDFADYRLEVNMVKSGEAAVEFERELREKTVPYWEVEMRELREFASRELGLDEIEPWDQYFVTERMRLARYELDAEELRPYFPLEGVLEGLFEITRRLFGVQVERVENDAVWHPDVDFFEVRDETGRHLGSFYADWFPRDTKRAGAWMNGLIHGEPQEDGSLAPHLALMVANFTSPQDGRPALLTHREVQTIFHEFGHLLHHLLSKVEVPALAGTQVPRDWVELPSHIMENWTWQREALDLFARHFETGERIPEELFRRLQAARNFMEANAQMRQLSFGTVDLSLHIDFDPRSADDPLEFSNRIRERFVLRPEFAHDGFLCAFSHIFAGGYAAGYYSYKWSEMLEADAFTRFEQNGIFDRATGQAYLESILSRGDSRDQFEQFREFMGRDPDPEALLRRNLGSNYRPSVASG